MEPLTQTVEVRVFSSDTELNDAMQKKVNEIYAGVLASPAVVDAFEAYESARGRVAQLKQAQARLTAQSKRIFDGLKELSTSLEAALIEAHASGQPPDVAKALREQGVLEAEHRAVSRANSRVLEHLLPQAEIAELRAASGHYDAKAKVVRAVAAERIQKTANLMAEAAEYEGGIVFDPVKTLSGELHFQANEFETQAANYQRWAAERAEQYAKLAKELESIESITAR